MSAQTQDKLMLDTEDGTAPQPDCGQLFKGFFILGLNVLICKMTRFDKNLSLIPPSHNILFLKLA